MSYSTNDVDAVQQFGSDVSDRQYNWKTYQGPVLYYFCGQYLKCIVLGPVPYVLCVQHLTILMHCLLRRSRAVVPVCLSRSDVVNQHHLHKETGADARVVMPDSQTRQGPQVLLLHTHTHTVFHTLCRHNELDRMEEKFSRG